MKEKSKTINKVVQVAPKTKKKSSPKMDTEDAPKDKKKSSRKKSNPKMDAESETVVNSEYVKIVNHKRARNKSKMVELGLATKTPIPKKSSATSPKKSSTKKTATKQAQRVLMPKESPKKRKRRTKKSSPVCPCDHQDYSATFNEESDKRYCQPAHDLNNVKCQICNLKFANEADDCCIVPSASAPMYVCRGRMKHKCTHSLCFSCYQDRFMVHSSKRRTRNKS